MIGRTRAALVICYTILKNLFWVVLVFAILRHAGVVYTAAAFNISTFVAQSIEGLKTADIALISSSVIRLTLFVMLLMAMTILIASLGLKLGQLTLAARN